MLLQAAASTYDASAAGPAHTAHGNSRVRPGMRAIARRQTLIRVAL
jgi:hypothetical protein